MNSKSRSLLLAALVAGSTGLIAPARSQSAKTRPTTPTAEQLAQAQQFCQLMRRPAEVACMASPKTGQAVTFPSECLEILSTASRSADAKIPSGGIRLNNGAVCTIDPKTDLPMMISPAPYPASPAKNESIDYKNAQKLADAAAVCASMRLPDGLSCQASLKTRSPVVFPTICGQVLAAVSLPAPRPGDKNILEAGISLNGSPVCAIDPKTDLPILIPTMQTKALPPIKSRQERAKAAFAAGAPTGTRSTMPGACSGINLPNGMMCLMDAKTGKSKVLPNPCLDWRIPAGLTCVVDPETASPLSIRNSDLSPNSPK